MGIPLYLTRHAYTQVLLSYDQFFASPRIVAQQAPLSMEFSRHEYWSGLLFPSPGNPPNPGMKPRSPALQADFLPTELPNPFTLKRFPW